MSEPNNKNAPAFPADADLKSVYRGLTKREYFAGQISSQIYRDWGLGQEGEMARRAVLAADALIAALAQPDLTQPDLSQPNLTQPTPTPEPSPGTVRFPVVEIGDQAVHWWEFRGGDENSPPRTYGGHTVYADQNGLWINTNTGYRTYLQPSATLDPLP